MPYRMQGIPGIADVPAGWLHDLYAYLDWVSYYEHYNTNAQRAGVFVALPAYVKEPEE